MTNDHRPGAPSVFSCPECGGTLWELHEGDLVRYQCRVGHAFSPESLLSAQSDTLEDALWAALRALEEKVSLGRRLRDRAAERGHAQLAARFAEEMDGAQERADVIRRLLLDGAGTTPVLTGTPEQTSESSDRDDARRP